MGTYEATLRALVISLRGRMNAMAEYSLCDEERRDWNLCSAQVDALEAEISSLAKEQHHD